MFSCLLVYKIKLCQNGICVSFFCNFALMKPRIIIDANIPYIRGAFDDVANVEYLVAKDITHDKVVNADALIVRTRTQ